MAYIKSGNHEVEIDGTADEAMAMITGNQVKAQYLVRGSVDGQSRIIINRSSGTMLEVSDAPIRTATS